MDPDLEAAARKLVQPTLDALVNPPPPGTPPPVNLTDVEKLEERHAAWLERADVGTASEYVRQELVLLKDRHTVTGTSVSLLSEDALRQADAQVRQEYDATLQRDGDELADQLRQAAQQLDAAIADAENVPPEHARYKPDSYDRLVVEGVALQAETAVRARLAGRTRAQALALYRQADASLLTGRALMRLIEAGTLNDRLPDPATDAGSMLELQQAIAEHHTARVPDWLRQARERIGKLQRDLTFGTKLAHLRSGRSIARQTE